MACYRCWRGEFAMAGTKFSLLGFCALRAVQNSPCFCILGKYSRYFACWESFVPLGACSAGCWESFVPLGACSAGCVESFVLGRSFSDAVGFTVMTSLCSGCEKVRPVRSDVNANAKKFAQQGKNGLKIAVHGVLGEFFRENVACVPLLGELCRARGLMRLVPGELCRGAGCASCWASVVASRAPGCSSG